MIGPVPLADGMRPYGMPGSSPPVGLKRLLTEPDGSFHVAVSFPVGFHRPGPGWYLAAEEFTVLDGDLVLSGRTCRPGEYVSLPAGCLRSDTQSAGGALVFAWFERVPSWIPGSEADAESTDVTAISWADIPTGEGPLGPGRRIGAFHGAEAWLLEGITAGLVSPGRCVLVSLATRTFVALAPGDATPEVSGPILARFTT